MKKFFLFACCLFVSAAMLAQPSLQYPQNAPEIGDIMEIQFVNPDGLSHLPVGPDVNWDFSQLSNTGGPWLITAISPASAPMGNEFPLSNVVLNMGDSIFTFVMVDETAAFNIGSHMSSSMFEATMIYSDTRKYMQYPFTYNDAFADTYKGVSSSLFAEVRVSANSSVLGDSYGTLVLPNGTYTNVLRTTTIDNEIDSIFTAGFLVSVSSSVRTQYSWYASNSFGPLLSMEILAGLNGIDTVCYYATSGTGIGNDQAKSVSQLSVFPNPANDHIIIAFNTAKDIKANIMIVNQIGQVMINKTIPDKTEGMIKERIDISKLPSGIYFANISCGCGKQLTEKFVIR